MTALVAMIFPVIAVSGSFIRLRHVLRAWSFDVDALRAALGRTADASLLQELGALLRAEGCGEPGRAAVPWEAELITGLAEATTPRARTATVNEALHDAERALGWGAQMGKAAPRCAAAGPLGVLFWSLARQTVTVSDVLCVFAWGIAGFVACWALSHECNRLVAQRRRSIDMWVDQLLIAAEIR